MKKFLKKYFIPHKGNSYKPHIWRDASLLFMFSVILVVFAVAISSNIIRSSLTALVLPKVLVDYTNSDRLALNYGSLTVNSVLEKAAKMKADDMAAKGYFAHNTPDGHSPWYWFKQAGYDFSYAGENLAVNFVDSVDVNQAWMNSEGHRKNILNGNFTEIGIATAEGVYQGRATVFVVQLFGRPAVKNTTTVNQTVVTKLKSTNVTQNTATVTPVVLSESASSEMSSENGTSELFISVQKESDPVPQVSGTVSQSNLIEKAVMSPKKTLGIVYGILSALIIIGLVFLIFVEIKRQHPRLIIMGVGLLVIICGLLYIYKSVLFAPLLIA